MPQFLIATHDEPGTRDLTPEEMAPIYEAVGGLISEAIETGILVFAGGLEGQDATTVIDPRGESTTRTQGPLNRNKEYLGGMSVIEVPDLETALDWGTRMAEASRLPQEVRPFQSEPDAE